MTKLPKTLPAWTAALSLALFAPPASTGGAASGQLGARMVLQAGCMLTGENGAGMTQIVCSPDASALSVDVRESMPEPGPLMLPTAGTALGIALPPEGLAFPAPTAGGMLRTSARFDGNSSRLMANTAPAALEITFSW